MSDHTADLQTGRAGRMPRAEFRVYFTLILVLAIPFSVLRWAGELARSGRLPPQGPFARAWADARVITPVIFSA